MKRKKLISGLISVCLIFVLFTQNVNSESKADPFADVNGENLFYSAITDLYESGVVEGYSDNSFKPEKTINRAEFTKILILASGKTPSGSSCFTDVNDQWFAPYVCKAKDLGIVDGYADGSFKPGKNINFAEASKIISNTYGLIKDKEDPNLWYKHFVYSLEDYSAIPTSVLSFDKLISRGEMSEMVYRIRNGFTQKAYNTFDSISKGEVSKIDTVSMKNFRSCEQIQAYMSHPSYDLRTKFSDEMNDGEFLVTEDSAPLAPSTGDMGESSKTDSMTSSDDYSSTNLQVEGVDEADIVKTDGEYIYVLKGNTVRIVDAKPAESMKEVSFVEFPEEDFYPSDMYVSGNRLVVLGTYYGMMPTPYAAESKIAVMPPYYYEDLSMVKVFDISDKSNVVLFREFELEGYTLSSRKIGDMLYLVANKYEYLYYPYFQQEDFNLPLMRDTAVSDESMPVSDCSDISYFPGIRENNRFLMVFGVPLNDKNQEVVKNTVVASGNEIYVSPKNLYVAESRYDGGFRIMGDIYSSEEKTIVHKFSLSSSSIDYKGNGEVPGTVLNQFSMDERGNDFRIATTRNNWSLNSDNNLYVMDSSLNVVGKLEGVAKGERIYSVRFMGERAYMVTFRETDPFYVIDLMDARNPKILGELKLPGFSDYLHPYDENHIMGFGKETTEDEVLGGPLHQGMKIAMFDVTDVSDPKLKHQTIIGDRGTYSELLYNHKALLFNKEKGLLAFPVSVAEISDEVKDDSDWARWAYGDTVFQGAYIYNVSLDKGFELKGQLTHISDSDKIDNYGSHFYGEKAVDRVLYIGDVLYTVSKAMVKANRMDNLNEISKTNMGGSTNYWNFLD